MPSLPPAQRDEAATRRDMAAKLRPVACEDHQVLILKRPQGNHHAAALSELLDQCCRDLWRGSRY